MTKRTKKTADDLLWAQEVMEVYKNLGSMPGKREWSSPSVSHFYDWVVQNDRQNESKFLIDLVPKATALLAKHGLSDVADAVLEIDTKTVKELQRCLRDALGDSADGPYVETEPEPEQESMFETLALKDIEDKTVKHFRSSIDDTDLENDNFMTLEDIIG